MRRLFVILYVFLSCSGGFCIISDPPVFDHINNNNLEAVSKFISEHEINGVYGRDSLSLLVYSISREKTNIVDYLLSKGADPNQYVKGKSPVMFAVQTGRPSLVRLLIKYHADVNAEDAEKNTPLIYAAKHGNMRNIKILLKNDAYLNHKNYMWLTAYDFAVRSGHSEAARYLKSKYERELPSFHDGPYISWKNNGHIRAFYIVHDSTRKHTKRIDKRFIANTNPYSIKGFSADHAGYDLWNTIQIPETNYSGINRLMVIGDIHGGYDSLVLFLRNNNVIDDQHNWTWGDGHVLFLGDIFDRGDKVTEALWLIYRLEHQAVRNGGFVHLILGNHEVMTLEKDHRFLTDKYFYLCKKLNITYGNLYNKNTVLGKWLRSKNTIVKIDDKLFVHAGISTDIPKTGLSPEELNIMVRYFLNYPERNRKFGLKARELIMGMRGPFWYRGYVEDHYYIDPLTDKDISSILNYYGVSSIYIGHTNVDKISTRFEGRVIMMDVPFYTYGHSMEALLIEGNVKFLLNSSGTKKSFE